MFYWVTYHSLFSCSFIKDYFQHFPITSIIAVVHIIYRDLEFFHDLRYLINTLFFMLKYSGSIITLLYKYKFETHSK